MIEETQNEYLLTVAEVEQILLQNRILPNNIQQIYIIKYLTQYVIIFLFQFMCKKNITLLVKLLQRNSFKNYVKIQNSLNPSMLLLNYPKVINQQYDYSRQLQLQINDLSQKCKDNLEIHMRSGKQIKMDTQTIKNKKKIQNDAKDIIQKLNHQFQIPNILEMKEFIHNLNPRDKYNIYILKEVQTIVHSKLNSISNINLIVKQLGSRLQIDILAKQYDYYTSIGSNVYLKMTLARLIQITKSFFQHFPTSQQGNSQEYIYWSLQYAKFSEKHSNLEEAMNIYSQIYKSQNPNLQKIKLDVLIMLCNILKRSGKFEELETMKTKSFNLKQKQIIQEYLSNQTSISNLKMKNKSKISNQSKS